MFTNLGRVKTAKRASLSQGTLQDLLRIQAEGPPLESYEPSTAVQKWDRAKRRRPNPQHRKVYKQRSTTLKCVLVKEDSSNEASSSEETLFRNEEEAIDKV